MIRLGDDLLQGRGWIVMAEGQMMRGYGLSAETVKCEQVMTVNALCEYESEYTMPRWMARTAIVALVGLKTASVPDSMLYRALDELLPHSKAIKRALVERDTWLEDFQTGEWE